MQKPMAIVLGKVVKSLAQLRGGGSALPGLFVERIDADFISRTLAQLPEGVVLVSGTNGKTTTTKMVVELFEGQGLKVFTNRTGSNFTRGVAAALLGEIDFQGKLGADIAVLELDEAHAVQFVRRVPPKHSILLNVMRDQLDRFGEIDYTASLLKAVAEATTDTIVINREDPRLLAVSKQLPEEKIRYFGLNPSLRKLFPSDDELRSDSGKSTRSSTIKTPDASGVLEKLEDRTLTFTLSDEPLTASLKLEGIYNVFNAIAAATLVSEALGSKLNTDKLVRSLESITPAFGRGEKLMVDGQPLELVLVKNPGGFRLGLSSFKPEGYATMIAINDNYADGRDMSWLWDVEFESLAPSLSHVTGIRAYDMALRLQYDEIEIGTVEPKLTTALRDFIARNKHQPKRIYCTYTAMLALRRELGKMTKVEVVS
jgi:UDP-N-acetylmuramyl tripeptide synthase